MGRRLEQRQLRAAAHTAFRSSLGASPSVATSSTVSPLGFSGALAMVADEAAMMAAFVEAARRDIEVSASSSSAPSVVAGSCSTAAAQALAPSTIGVSPQDRASSSSSALGVSPQGHASSSSSARGVSPPEFATGVCSSSAVPAPGVSPQAFGVSPLVAACSAPGVSPTVCELGVS